jgi:hypothetical protein
MLEQQEFNFEGGRKNGCNAGLELPYDPAARGYVKFQAEQAEYFRELGNRYGISLNKRVRIKLKDIDREFEGKLVMAQLLPPNSPHEKLCLRVGSIDFDFNEIEYAVLLEQ